MFHKLYIFLSAKTKKTKQNTKAEQTDYNDKEQRELTRVTVSFNYTKSSQSVCCCVPRHRLCDHLHVPQLRLLGALLDLLRLRLQLHLLWNVCAA